MQTGRHFLCLTDEHSQGYRQILYSKLTENRLLPIFCDCDKYIQASQVHIRIKSSFFQEALNLPSSIPHSLSGYLLFLFAVYCYCATVILHTKISLSITGQTILPSKTSQHVTELEES